MTKKARKMVIGAWVVGMVLMFFGARGAENLIIFCIGSVLATFAFWDGIADADDEETPADEPEVK